MSDVKDINVARVKEHKKELQGKIDKFFTGLVKKGKTVKK